MSRSPVRKTWRVRVSVEYDMGGTVAAPKLVRLFVSYWIRNDTSLSLSYRVVEIDLLDNLDADSMPVSRGVKSAKFALKHSSQSIDKSIVSTRRNSVILEVIDETTQIEINKIEAYTQTRRNPAELIAISRKRSIEEFILLLFRFCDQLKSSLCKL
ncbi:hypothetical protein KSP39_PZI016604 [Platanthera zijinensis]|uniref:Uncharacterized protein n=1 Tax=Platanthera zijinensis TaxID=2320716 RepID=A0AAP0B7E2_9ASPA